MPTSPLWKGRLATRRAATPGVATGGDDTGGDATGGDDVGPVGVEDGLAVGPPTAVDGEASGEFEPVTVGWVQAAKSSTNVATHAAGTGRLLTRLSRTIG
ncbi:MAG: hypothetical protein ABI959_07625 [Candidatus Dormiibacterota bacterium]